MYKFFGHESKSVTPISNVYKKIRDQRHLYDLLSDIWCKYSCAPRMRIMWSESNKTLGQCSITSFLVQDIFGGEVFGVPLSGGGIHCFNVIGEVEFDLTSEQFGDEKLVYTHKYPQSREEHFLDEDKKARYLYLKKELLKKLLELHKVGNTIVSTDDEGKIVASISFKVEDNIFTIEHTFVSDEYRGEGIASILVEEAVKYIDSVNGKIKATCSYAREWLKKHGRD